MVKHKQSIVVMAKVLVMALLIGVFAAIPSAETFAAANKALRTKVTFNGDKSEEAWENNSYYLGIGYKKASKIKKNMKLSVKVYVPASALKKNWDRVYVNTGIDLENSKNGKYAGTVSSRYPVILIKDGKKIQVELYDSVTDRNIKAGKLASCKKSGKYYMITINNMPLRNVVSKDEKESKINTKTKYNIIQGVAITGVCSKSSGYIYVDDIKFSGVTTQKITFNKKDYKFCDCSHLEKQHTVKVTTIK